MIELLEKPYRVITQQGQGTVMTVEFKGSKIERYGIKLDNSTEDRLYYFF